MELLLFGGAFQRGRRAFPASDYLRHLIEITSADLALVFGRGVTVGLGRELRLLQFRIRLHSSIATALRELKHAVIERVETGQGNELEFVAHRPQFTLKLCDTSAIEMQDYHFLYWSKKESRSITCPHFRKNVKIEEGSRAFDECSGLVQRAFIRNGSRSLGSISFGVREADDSKTRLPRQRA